VKLLTLARDLQRRRARERHNQFVAEGIRTVEELLRSAVVPRGALVSPALAGSLRGEAVCELLHARGVLIDHVTDGDFATATSTESPQGVLVVAEVPPRDLNTLVLQPRARVLVLDGVQDPGNVGTLLRTAAALGVDATFAMPGTVDLWNAKVVRSAMGAIFQHPALACTWDALDEFRAARHVPLWAADAAGTILDKITVPASLALIVGNEGAGLSDFARSRAEQGVAIPIVSAVESLNVAVAAGILLYHLRP
jgi:TrmH family RNA methyltransferase